MCLLVTQSKTSPVLSNECLSDFYSFNSDGVGVMSEINGELVIKKILPKSAHDFIEFYHANIKGKNCAFHLRMRTHGNFDLENCHPYEVLNQKEHGLDLWLMHNGILSTGNAKDITKSDTWHYIRDFLRPMLENNPDFFLHPSFAQIVGEHIGASNKFVLMDNDGRMVTINHEAGVYWAGLWLSNTYAWSVSKSASKKPNKSAKDAKAQAKEKPQAYAPKSHKYNSHAYWDSRADYFDGEWLGNVRERDYRDADERVYDDLDAIFDEFEMIGYFKASDITYGQIFDFIDRYNEDSFFDIAYACMGGDIDEDTYIKCISDYAYARECFPKLNRVADLQLA